MSNHTLSALVNSELCQSCANCCKVFRFLFQDSEDIVERYRLLEGDCITVQNEQSKPGNDDIYSMNINIPCSKLDCNEGRYSCAIWGSPERPALCDTYPSNQFIGADNKVLEDRNLIQQIIDSNKELCPAFKDLNVDEIIKRINSES